MNIKTEKTDILKNMIVQDLLKNGILPTYIEVNKKLNELISVYPETISYKPIIVEEHETSNNENYNKMFKNLEDDLNFAYKLNNKYTKRISDLYENYLIEVNKLQKDLERIQIRTNNIKDIMLSSKFSQTKFINFDNFYDIEFDGDPNSNIPVTTSFVDLNTKTIANNKLPGTIKYNLIDSVIDIVNENNVKKVNFINEATNILNDNFDESFIYEVLKDTEEDTHISIIVKLKNIIKANLISLKYTANSSTTTNIEITSDGINYIKLNDIKGLNVSEWNMKSQNISAFKINITKDNADNISKDGYKYYFIINNISIFKETYENKSIFVSKPLNFNGVINAITLKAEENKDFNTNVEYFIGEDDNENKISWLPINNNEIFKFNILKSKRKIINEATLSEDNTFIKLYNLENTYNINSLKIYPAYQMWKKEIFTVRKNINHIVTMTDYNLENLLETDYVSTDDCFLDLKGYNMAVLSQYIFCEEEAAEYGRYIKANDNYPISCRVFLNNSEIKTINNYYNLKFKKGKNKLNIFIYCPAVANADIEALHTVTHNFNLKDISFNIFAEPKMNYINKNTLINKETINNLKYFTIDDNNNILLLNQNNNNNIKYLITYNYLNNIDLRDETSLRVMAILTSKNNDITPTVANIKVTAE